MNKEKRYMKAGVSLGIVIACVFIAFVVVMGMIGTNVVENVVHRKELKPVDVFPVGDASLEDGATKVMYIMHYPHQAVPTTAYASNLSNATAYEYMDGLNNSEMEGETPYGTAFDVVIKVGINTTHGYNSTSSAWELTLHNATMDGITGYGFTTDVAMNETAIGNDSSWNYVHYYLQDADGGGGTGFTIAQGVKTNATFEFWAFQ